MVDSCEYDAVYFGNPIMDLSVDDPEKTLLSKYGLDVGQITLATPEQLPIYAEIYARDDKLISPGGAALNSCRAHKSENKDSKIAYFGCLGNDEYGQKMKDAIAAVGIDGKFATTDEEPTGTCAVAVVNKERTLCANIAASKKYPLTHLEENLSVLSKAKMFYTTGFFVDSNFGAVKRVAEFAAENDKAFCLNISAPFVIFVYKAQLEEVFPYCDYIFCNEDEAATLAETYGFQKDQRVEVAQMLAKGEKKNTSRPRVVIFTMGAEPTIVVTCQAGQEPTVEHVAVEPIAKELIVDTNGAGDSFVGAFINTVSGGKTAAEGVQAGNTCAGKIIQKSGVIFD